MADTLPTVVQRELLKLWTWLNPIALGNIDSYDPTTHMARVRIVLSGGTDKPGGALPILVGWHGQRMSLPKDAACVVLRVLGEPLCILGIYYTEKDIAPQVGLVVPSDMHIIGDLTVSAGGIAPAAFSGLPRASRAWANKLIVLNAPGAVGLLYLCALQADGVTYAWMPVKGAS